MTKSISLAAAVAAALTSGVAMAELTGNAAITNNYIWRGVTQTQDQAAGQGGLDFGFGPGFYVGTWLSNVDFSGMGDGTEVDLYAGWGGEAGSFGYDLGVLTYQYPNTPEFNFTEVYASGSWKIISLGIAYTADAASGNEGGVYDKGDMYVNGSLDFDTKAGGISLYAGSYMFDNSSQSGNPDFDYIHYGASLSKGDFTFALDKNDIEGGNADNVRVTVMWSTEFELM